MDRAATRTADERKVATILFADLVGSTALSTRLDPEALRAIVLEYFETLSAAIETYGGTVEKFIGDAVMAVFGVPTTHEDDVRRALAAALELLRKVEELNARLALGHDGVRLEVRVGVNTGEVIATRDSSSRQALVSGEVVNLAARLEQHASPGEILIGADTHAAAGPLAVTGEPRMLQVKGKEEPIHGYPLQDVLPDDPETARRFDLPFVGRAPELATLDLVLERVAGGGAASMVLLRGDPGIGKTRLVTEWLGRGRRAETAPAWAVVRCRSYAEDGSMRPMRDLVDQLGAPDADAVFAGALPDAYARVVDLLESVATGQPLVVVVDDCHWASTMLLDLLDRLADDLADVPVMVVCVARPELADTYPQLGRGTPNFTSIELTGMADDELATLAGAFSEVGAHGADASRALVGRAEGNPLHLEQLAAAARDGALSDAVPATIRALLAARVDVLSDTERALLDGAAVIGREFTVADVAALVEVPGEDERALHGTVRGLARRHLLEPVRHPVRHGGVAHATTSATHRFASALIHEVVYQAMTKGRRAGLHERHAALLADRGGTDAAIGGQLEKAYRCRLDLGLGGPAADEQRVHAAGHLVSAGVSALRRVDLPWAVDLLGRAVAIGEPGDPRHAEALTQYGEALLAAGDRSGARDALRRAQDSARDTGNEVVAAHALLLRAQVDPEVGAPAEVARRSMDVFARHADDLGLTRARTRIAEEHQAAGRHLAAVTELEAALEPAVRAGADIEHANVLGALGLALWWGPVPVDQAIARCRALLTEHGEGRRAVQATLGFPLAVLCAIAGCDEEAAAYAAATRLAAQELGHAEADVFAPLLGGMVAALAGRAGDADAELAAAHRSATRLGSPYLSRLTARELARLRLDAGRVGDAAGLVGAASTGDGTVADRADLAGLAARVAAARGDGGEALRLAAVAVDAAGATDSTATVATAHLDGARVRVMLGDTTGAREAATAARDLFVAKGHVRGVAWTSSLSLEVPDGRSV